jgi:Mlc titration factor MtfA (ptsG expression regulator)
MDIVAVFFLLLILLGFAALFIFIFYSFIRAAFIDPVSEFLYLSKGLTPEQRIILEKNFSYYTNLSPSNKKEFEKRLKYFLHDKQFIGKSMPEVTEEMKILVGASAVQLTFGYHPIRFAHFDKITLFPGRFYAKGSDKLRKGEVNPAGKLIVLSWKDFIKDYKIPNDGFNLGLHEMAHAFKVEDLTHNEEYSFINEQDLKYFYRTSEEEFKNIQNGEDSFLRSYAGTNREEFFAVAVEQFFEQPKEFKEKLPKIYSALSKLLNQDPLLVYKT